MRRGLLFWVVAIGIIVVLFFVMDLSKIWNPVPSESDIESVGNVGDLGDDVEDIDAGIEDAFEFVQ